MGHDDMFDAEFIKETKGAVSEFLHSNDILTADAQPVPLTSFQPSWSCRSATPSPGQPQLSSAAEKPFLNRIALTVKPSCSNALSDGEVHGSSGV
jgi:hypothetical protein